MWISPFHSAKYANRGVFQRTRERYQALAKEDDSIITIDASQTMDKVQADIRQILTAWLAHLPLLLLMLQRLLSKQL